MLNYNIIKYLSTSPSITHYVLFGAAHLALMMIFISVTCQVIQFLLLFGNLKTQHVNVDN